MSFPQYERYKDSGVEWLGEVPEHWAVGNIRHFAQMKTGHTPSRTATEYWEECNIPWFTLADVWQLRDGRQKYLGNTKGLISRLGLENSAAELLPVGTVVFSRTASIGFSGIMPIPMATSQDFWNWIPRKQLTSDYLLYQFRSMRQVFDCLTMGSTHKTIYQPDAASLSICVPTIKEQRKIGTFLDRETVKIDALIAEQQRLIELLKEKRQAVISHAVTKGLTNLPGANLNAGACDGGPEGERRDSASSPDAPMKDSGIEWLGEVPSHWQCAPLKYAALVKAGYAFSSDDFATDGVPVLRIGDITKDGCIDFANAKYLPEPFLIKHRDVLVKKTDIVMAMTGATIGKAGRYECESPALLNQRVCIFRPKFEISQGYVWYVLNARFYGEYLSLTAFGGAQPNISDTQLLACYVAVPPFLEQCSIAAFLDRETAKLDTLTTESQTAITLLQERRTALISAAVTGKIDVRGAVNAEAA